MPRKKSFRMRRVRSVGQVSDVKCCRETKKVNPLLCGAKHFSMVGRDDKRTELYVLGRIRHEMSNVCTWKSGVLDAICDEGGKLIDNKTKPKTIVGQYKAFNKICVLFGKVLHGSCECFSTALQETLLEQPCCLLTVDGYYCAVVYHKELFIMFNFNAFNSSGLPTDMGSCVAQWMTSLNETMLLFLSLFTSSNAERFSVVSVKVKVVDENNGSMGEQQVCPSQQLCSPDGVKLLCLFGHDAKCECNKSK